jgi:adenylate cyclase
MRPSLFDELRRRRVFRGLAIYGAVAFTVVQAFDILIAALHLPGWLLTFLVVAALLGLPIAAVLVWMFDFTPEGVQRTGVPDHTPELVLPRRPVAVAIYMGLGAVIGIVGLAAFYAIRPTASSAEGLDSVAVLPFRTIGNVPEQEYFADGMTEELINALVNVPGLRVASRSAVFRYKNQEWTAAAVGRELNVKSILDGSIRKNGDTLRLSVQLVDVESGSALWSENYDRDLKQVFSIQEEIARAVANRVLLESENRAASTLVRQSTDQVGAYELYLQGRFHWNQRTPDGMRRALDFFQQALVKDSMYGLAYSGVADVLIGMANFGFVPATEVMPRAEQAAVRAVSVDPWLGEAHATMGHIYELYKYDWKRAEQEYDRAVQLNPKYIDGHAWRGQFLVMSGRKEEGLAAIRHAVDLDPLHIPTRFVLAMGLYHARDYEDAVSECTRILDMVPSYGPAPIVKSLALIELRRFDEARAVIDAAERVVGPNWQLEVGRATAYAREGRMKEANQSAARFSAMTRERFVPPHASAILYAGLGDKKRAMDFLDRAYEERWPLILSANVAVQWDPLRSDPRFIAWARKLNFGSP